MALGGFVVQQWVKYQWKSLRYQSELTDNVYYRNINNNAGIFDYLIGAAEDQECKEAFLAYYFLHTAAAPLTADELEGRIEAWLRQTFGVEIDFAVNGALGKLEGLGLLRREKERLFVSPLDGASRPTASAYGIKFLTSEPEAAGQITEIVAVTSRPRPAVNSSSHFASDFRQLFDIRLIESGDRHIGIMAGLQRQPKNTSKE